MSVLVRRIVTWSTLVAFSNIVLWAFQTSLPALVSVMLAVIGLVFYCLVNINPAWHRPALPEKRLVTLANGYELLLAAGVCLLCDVVCWVWLLATGTMAVPDPVFVGNIVFGVVLAGIMALGGFLRLCFRSSQISVTTKILVALTWWFVPLTVVLLGRAGRTANRELATAVARAQRDRLRANDNICRTRYPMLLVHGIFFRDWQHFNYWGRIPAALTRNGATIFYGGQQSAASVADSAAELASVIDRIVAETGCGKVNIIAHSKGGLDARWAISQLGSADKVASLTTVNTPHRGCEFARQLMQRIPQTTTAAIDRKYNALFSRLGDPSPDFLAGLVDLTDTECARLNTLMPDVRGVLYRSVGSQMASRFASPFPLSLGYSLIEPLNGPNDGLVAVSSMPWGEFLGVVEPHGKQGISHGDMIDLLRQDIGGFDVCEFYVQLVADLKARGL